MSNIATITTIEEGFILDEILYFLILRGAFTIQAMYENFILTQKYKEEGDIYLEKIKRISDYHLQRNVYAHLSEFLIENSFANSTTDGLLLLTRKGEYLCAHQHLEVYNAVVKQKMSLEQIISRVPLLISKISPYKVFSIESPPAAKATDYFISVVPSPGNEVYLKEMNDDIESRRFKYMEELIKEHNSIIFDEQVAEYLVDEGFAIERFDVPSSTGVYRQLTESGRDLKKLGSISAFEQMQALKEAELLSLQNDRKRDFQRNEYQFWVNFSIAISTGIAAVFYFFGLFDFYKNHSAQWVNVAYFLSGFGLAILMWLAQWQLKKISKQKANAIKQFL